MKFIILTLSSFLFSVSALAFPQAPVDSLDWAVDYVSERSENYDFNGIVGLSNCSGSIIHFKDQPLSSQAYVLTNGHCLRSFFGGFLKPGEVRYKKSSTRSMNAFIKVDETIRVRANQLVYATMTDTDVAIYRLNSTYADLKAQGIESFELSSERTTVGQEIQIVSGYWKAGFDCSVEHHAYELHESNWTMKDSIRYSPTGCEVYGGTSGSPVIQSGERLVVAINNTGNESGKECEMNNPCEVDESGNITVIKGRGYAQQTYWFYSCLSDDFEIDLDIEGCTLPKPQ